MAPYSPTSFLSFTDLLSACCQVGKCAVLGMVIRFYIFWILALIAQRQALGLAIFNIALTVQAYISTQLRAEEVLVWMPLTVLLDVGATLQMVVLIIEMHRHGDTRQRGLRVLCAALGQGFTDLRTSIARNLLQKQKPEAEADSGGVFRYTSLSV
jgi:hypothetical protein